MRIGMMADVYKPHVSGITNYISLYKHYLEQTGHEVFVFTFGDLEYADDETRIIRSPGLPLVDTGYYLNFRYNQPAKRLLQTMDLVHVHHPFLSGRLALRYCRPAHIPIVFTNHTRYDLYAQAYLPMLPEELSESFLQSYMPTFCDAVDLVIAPSLGMVQVLGKLGVTSPIEVLPNGVELQRFKNACIDRNCRAEFGFSENDILLVYVGRLAPEKNVNFLIDAFSGVAEAVDNTHLLIAGSGPEEENLHHQVDQLHLNKRTHFLGMVDYKDLPSRLAMCDVFVTASVTEVHPLSVIEAMATGLPVVGIRSVGVGDTVEDRINGLLASQDQAAFAAALTRLCLDGALRRRLGAAARLGTEKYAIEHTTRVMLDHYEHLLEVTRANPRGLGTRIRHMLKRLFS